MGNFITGTYLEEDDVVSAEATQLNGRDFYVYEVRPWTDWVLLIWFAMLP